MAIELPLELLQWLYKVLLNEYRDPKRTYQDVCVILINYPTLKPRTRVYTNEYGRSQLLLNIYGHLKLSQLEIPIDIWFPFEYPSQAPITYILPNEQFIIKPTNHVQQDGLVFHPFLYDWNLIQDDKDNLKIMRFMSLLNEILNRDLPCIFKPNVQHRDLPPQLPPKPISIPTTPAPVATPPQQHQRLKSPSPPIYKELEQLSLMDQDTNHEKVPKLPPNPTRLELLNSLNLNLLNISELVSGNINNEILLVLEYSNKDLLFLQNEVLKIEQDQIYLDKAIKQNNFILDDKITQVKTLNAQLRQQPESDIDEMIMAPTLQHQQLYELVTRDKSITDTIQLLTKLYELEKLQLSQTMKFVRKLAREQFLCRALMKKIVNNLQLQETCTSTE